MLSVVLAPYLDSLPLDCLQHIWFQQDTAVPNSATDMWQLSYPPGIWIGHNRGPIAWLTRLSDLTSVNFSIKGHHLGTNERIPIFIIAVRTHSTKHYTRLAVAKLSVGVCI
jgi:hypothetical protein